MAKRDHALYIRCEPELVKRLDQLAERYPVVSRSGLARLAISLGLDAIVADPSLILTAGAPAKPAAPKKTPTKKGTKRRATKARRKSST